MLSTVSSAGEAAAGVAWRSAELGWGDFWAIATDERTVNALRISFGTALMVGALSFTSELWHGDLEIVPIEDWEVTRMLDRVLAMASTVSEFLLDESFSGFLTPEETRLKTLLRELERGLGDGVGDSHDARLIQRLLESYGGSVSAQ